MGTNEPKGQLKEETLDPVDWVEFGTFAHKLLDEAIGYARLIRQRRVWRGVPEHVRTALREAAPEEPQGAESAYEDFRRLVLPYTYANVHPRAWGWVIGVGTPQGILHETLAAAINCNVFGAEQSPVYVEEQVLSWFKQKLGYSPQASGILVSGASTANLIGLAVARAAMVGNAAVRKGLQSLDKPVALYCSEEAHNSLAKAATLLGLGTNSLRRIAVDNKFRISIPDLLSRISHDRQIGCTPLCVVGNAGTVNTGAIDDLQELATICERERLWFHVDGAFGALLKLSPSLAPLVSGLERADSVAFDLHKWMHMPYDAACILTRHAEQHRSAFSSAASYLEKHSRGIGSGNTLFAEYGIETSRPFRALKIWLALKENGFARYARIIEQNVAQAQSLAEKITEHPELRLLSSNLNIVCFQYAPPGFAESRLSELNRELLFRLHESGKAAPSYTTLDGRFAIRVAITNHRTTTEDIKLLVEEVARIGAQLAILE